MELNYDEFGAHRYVSGHYSSWLDDNGFGSCAVELMDGELHLHVSYGKEGEASYPLYVHQLSAQGDYLNAIDGTGDPFHLFKNTDSGVTELIVDSELDLYYADIGRMPLTRLQDAGHTVVHPLVVASGTLYVENATVDAMVATTQTIPTDYENRSVGIAGELGMIVMEQGFWQNGQTYTWDDVLTTDWTGITAIDVTDNGMIAARAINPTTQKQEYVLLMNLDIVADNNRDGKINDADNQQPANYDPAAYPGDWGAIYNVNLDSDSGEILGSAAKPDSGFIFDTGLIDLEDFSINGAVDMLDITPMVIRGFDFERQPQELVVELVSNESDLKAVHVFPEISADAEAIKDSNGDYWARATGGAESRVTKVDITKYLFPKNSDGSDNPDYKGITESTPVEQRYGADVGDCVFGLEGLLFRNEGLDVLPSLEFDGKVEFELRLSIGGEVVGSDSVILTVAPWIMLSRDQEAESVYVENNSSELKTSLPNALTVNNSGNQWLQDHLEIGYTQRPGGPMMHVAFRLPYAFDPIKPHVQPNWPVFALLGEDVGLYQLGARTMVQVSGETDEASLQTIGGNLEVFAPTADYPLGRIFMGAAPYNRLRVFLQSQAVQEPFFDIPVNWLEVGHIDEIFSFLSGGRVVVADPVKAWDLLEALPAAEQEKQLLFAKGDVSDIYTVSQTSDGSSQLGVDSQRLYIEEDLRSFMIDHDLDPETPKVPKYKYLRLITGQASKHVAQIKSFEEDYIEISQVWRTGISMMGQTGTEGSNSDYFQFSRALYSNDVYRDRWYFGFFPNEGSKFIMCEDTELWYMPSNYPDLKLPAIVSVKEVLNDENNAMKNFNRIEVNEQIYGGSNSIGALQLLQSEVAVTEVLRVPVLFFEGLTPISQVLQASAFNPNLVNLQELNGSFYLPNQSGAQNSNGEDLFESYTSALLGNGVYVDVWDLYHSRDGEVHCGSVVKRSAPTENIWEVLDTGEY